MREIARIWAATTSVITFRLLNLNDLGTQVGHEFSGVWRANHAAAFEHANALQGT
jgi:hypothetical protein